MTRRIAFALAAMLAIAGCSSPTESRPTVGSAATATKDATTPAGSQAAVPTATSTMTLGNAAPFPAAQWGSPWRAIGVGAKGSGLFTSVDGLMPPPGVYVLEWLMPSSPCGGSLDQGSFGWRWGTFNLGNQPKTGLDLAELSAEFPDEPYSATVEATCAPWGLQFRPVATYFGPNSLQVSRLLVLLDSLGPTWVAVDDETVSPDALELESMVLDAAKRDPNLGAAVQHALALDWYLGNHYILDHPNSAKLRRLAILAEVAQGLLPGSEFDTLYGPIARYVDPLSLGVSLNDQP
jgi:hypothetical protein